MKKRGTVLFAVCCGTLLFIWTCLPALAQDGGPSSFVLSAEVKKQLNAMRMEKAARTPAQKKMSSQLVHAVKARRGELEQMGLSSLRPGVKVDDDGTVLVDITARVTPGLLADIENLGGVIINFYEEYDAIRARVPLEAVEAIAEDDDVHRIGPAERYLLNKVNTSEGDAAHAANTTRRIYNRTGAGVKVGVLSDSVDFLSSVQSSGDLPFVTVLPGQAGLGRTGEGTAMLEIIHDLAPDAQLYFATAANGLAGFANNINALANAGCRIIVDDVFYLSESPFQDDVIARAVNTVTSRGVLYFSAAGNLGNLNSGTSGVWEGDYREFITDSPVIEGWESVHDFGGAGWSNRITRATPTCYTLFWSDPLGGSANDYDLFLVDPSLTLIMLASDDAQDGSGNPVEGICPDFDTTGYHLVVARWTGEDRFLHLSANRGTLEYATEGQISGHAAAADAFAVTAVGARDRTVPFLGVEPVQNYSSDGPRRMFYHPGGTPITPGNYLSTGGTVRLKPDLAAADCVRTATPGFNPFCGTSAATPHAAGIAALMLSQKPDLTRVQVREMMLQTALDIEAPGWDRDAGYGIPMADRVFETLVPQGINPGILELLLRDRN
jgi:subtilisin family serine protease